MSNTSKVPKKHGLACHIVFFGDVGLVGYSLQGQSGNHLLPCSCHPWRWGVRSGLGPEPIVRGQKTSGYDAQWGNDLGPLARFKNKRLGV